MKIGLEVITVKRSKMVEFSPLIWRGFPIKALVGDASVRWFSFVPSEIESMTWWKSSAGKVFLFLGCFYSERLKCLRVELRYVGQKDGVFRDYKDFLATTQSGGVVAYEV